MPKLARWTMLFVLVGLAVLTSLISGLTVSTLAQPVPIEDVRRFAHESTLILKGRVLEVHEVGTGGIVSSTLQSLNQATASVQVDSVLKGEAKPGIITVEFQQNHSGNSVYANEYSLSQSEYALFFLTGGRNGRYTFADRYTGAIPITSRNIPLAEAAHTTEGKLEAYLFASLSDPDREVAATALHQVKTLALLMQIDKERFENWAEVLPSQALRKIADSDDPESQGLAYAALINLGDYSLLKKAIQFVEKPSKDSNVEYWKARIIAAIGEIGETRIRRALTVSSDKRAAYCPSRVNIPIEQAVPSLLDSLLSSTNVNLRRAAAHALRGICDPSSARFLARALDDNDREVQYDAMMGLAALEDFPADRPAPSASIFNENPAKYLGPWKSWWKTVGKQKYDSIR